MEPGAEHDLIFHIKIELKLRKLGNFVKYLQNKLNVLINAHSIVE
jgi:hypothetical protein